MNRRPADNLISIGSLVGIVPQLDSSFPKRLKTATVGYIGSVYIETTNGRKYNLVDGKCLTRPHTGYLVPLTDDHQSL